MYRSSRMTMSSSTTATLSCSSWFCQLPRFSHRQTLTNPLVNALSVRPLSHARGGHEAAKQQATHRLREKLGMKMIEQSVATLPRLAVIQKRIGFQLVARKVFRGVAIALPGSHFLKKYTFIQSVQSVL
jgi:hypothetical protein